MNRGDQMGKRIFSLMKKDKGIPLTRVEKIGRPILPLFASYTPFFDQNFED